MSDVRVYRSRSTRWVAATLSFVFILVVLAGANGLAGGSKKSFAVTAVSLAVIVIAMAGIFWSLCFFAQMAVISSNEGIIIRNWFRRRSFRWDEIDAFVFGNNLENLQLRERLSSPVLQTYAVTNGGHHFVMSGLAATRINRSASRRYVQDLLDHLEMERVDHLRGAHEEA